MKELTDDEINEEICKWLGWKREHLASNTNWFPPKENWPNYNPVMREGEIDVNGPPNHLIGPEALGHIHEAEKRLTDDEYGSFATTLLKSAQEEGKTNAERGRLTLSAGARQRAIALLRVVKPELFQP